MALSVTVHHGPHTSCNRALLSISIRHTIWRYRYYYCYLYNLSIEIYYNIIELVMCLPLVVNLTSVLIHHLILFVWYVIIVNIPKSWHYNRLDCTFNCLDLEYAVRYRVAYNNILCLNLKKYSSNHKLFK